MDLQNQNYPFAYYKGKVTSFKRSEKNRISYFGGPGKTDLDGIEYGPHHIHHIATLWTFDLGISQSGFGMTIPFFYGMRFDGCKLKYRPRNTAVIEITEISPTSSSDDWPYKSYPPYLPYINLEVDATEEMSFAEVSQYVMQEISHSDPEILTLIVPPNPVMGVSMWGPSGDAEGVQIIFNYDPRTEEIEAYNACT